MARSRDRGVPVWAIGLAAGIGTLAIVAVVGAVVAYRMAQKGQQAVTQAVEHAASAVTGPTPDREGETWNHKDLLAHLNSKGLRLHMKPVHRLGTEAFFGTDPEVVDNSATLYNNRLPGYHAPGIVLVSVVGGGQGTKDLVGLIERPNYVWGRWLFVSDDQALIDRIRKALN